MPTDIYQATVTTPPTAGTIGIVTPPVTVPTFTNAVNSFDWDGNQTQPPATNWGSPGLNEADEMNIYTANRLDAPFGAGDLEWLYRYQDVDGASLVSRLQYLAPVSFLNPKDGFRRRRLFCLDTWEPTNFVWANDNPQGVFPTNSRFNPVTSASFFNLNNSGNLNVKPNPDPATDFSVASNSSAGNPNNYGLTPSIAHRDRRINLNFPLPVSNSPQEPVRQKWIRETYQLLKAVLPPKSVDTPEELAQLSQYVVNMIDFRDPDAAMTRFVNTDVIVTEPTSMTPPPPRPCSASRSTTLSFSTGNSNTVAYDPSYTPALPTPIHGTPYIGVPAHYLIQYGMEYQPVAINEVLAYQFQSKLTSNATANYSPTNYDARMQVELVNMLTKDAISGNYPDTSDIDLAGWDLVVLPDDAYGRPDPYTGQIPLGPQPGLYLPPDGSRRRYAGTPHAASSTSPSRSPAAASRFSRDCRRPRPRRRRRTLSPPRPPSRSFTTTCSATNPSTSSGPRPR